MKRHIQYIGITAALCALGSHARAFHDKDGDFTKGLADIADKLDAAGKKQETVAEEIKRLKTEISGDVDRWQTENKKLQDELTMLKNHHAEDVNGIRLKLKQCEEAYDRELALAVGPLENRIAPECKTFLNAMLRGMGNAKAGRSYQLTAEMKKALGSDFETKALTGDATPGSYNLATRLAKQIYDLLPTYGAASTLGQETLSTTSTTLNVDTADPIAYVVAQGAAIADDANITGTQVTAMVKNIAVLLGVSNDLLADAETDITGNLLKKLLRAISYRLDFLAFRADGTDDTTHGAYTGLFNFGTVKTAASGNTTVETLDFEDVTGTILTPNVQALSRQSKWWIHPHILVRMLHIKDSNGRPIFLTAMEAPTMAGLGSILGYPAVLSNVCPSTNSAGQKLAAFGDPDSFVVGTRAAANVVANDSYGFNKNNLTFRAMLRAAVIGRLAAGTAILKTAAS